MKITDVKTYFVRASKDNWVWVCVKTNEGLEGWGEVTGSSNDTVLAQLVASISTQLVGEDPLNIKGLRAGYVEGSYPKNGNNRFLSTAWSGIDQALWDIKAQSFGLPLYQLLGGYGTTQIPLYANLNRGLKKDRSAEGLKHQAVAALKEGFQFVKCAPFDELTPFSSEAILREGINRMESLLEEVPTYKIAIDCHHRFNRQSFIMLMEHLQEYDTPYWVEDIFSLDKAMEHQLIFDRYPNIRWAAGETSYQIQDVVQIANQRQFDIIMPDVKHCGGVSELKTIIPLVESYGLRISLHNPSGPLATAYSAHLLMLAQQPEPLEFAWGAAPERKMFTQPNEVILDGVYHLTDAPGVGLKPNNDYLEENAWVFEGDKWCKMKERQLLWE